MKRGWIKRFDPRFWAVNFPRPMMASVVTTASDALRFDAVFYRADDLAGLIWDAEDRHDHPLLAYETSRDFRGCVLSRSEEHTSELQSLMRTSSAVFCLQTKKGSGHKPKHHKRNGHRKMEADTKVSHNSTLKTEDHIQ